MNWDFLVGADNRPLQLELFPSDSSGFAPPDGVTHVPGLVPEHRSLFRQLASTIRWTTRYGTRETVTWGESYHLRNQTRTRHSWPDFLQPLASAIENCFGFLPNNCVANHYPDGSRTIGFHSDQGMEMRDGTGVVIISLGAMRHMVLRRIDTPAIRYHYALEPGSAFHMDDSSQAVWQHGILPEPGSGPRISLSFRRIIDTAAPCREPDRGEREIQEAAATGRGSHFQYRGTSNSTGPI